MGLNIKYGNHYYEIILLPPIHFQTIQENSERNIFDKIYNYFLEKFQISFHKLCECECLKTNISLSHFEFQNQLVKKTQILFDTSKRELFKLNKSIEEYLHYYTILLVLVCLNHFPKYSYQKIKVETAKRLFSNLFEKHFKANNLLKNQLSFNDYIGNNIKYFMHFLIKHTIMIYLGKNYNMYGETARYIADIIFEYSFNYIHYIGSFYLNDSLLALGGVKLETTIMESAPRSRRRYSNFSLEDFRCVFGSSGDIIFNDLKLIK